MQLNLHPSPLSRAIEEKVQTILDKARFEATTDHGTISPTTLISTHGTVMMQVSVLEDGHVEVYWRTPDAFSKP